MLKQPTLKEGINHIERFGGFFKGRGNGRVEWQDESARCQQCNRRGTEKEIRYCCMDEKEDFAERLVTSL